MNLNRPLLLLRFALECHDLRLADALIRRLGPIADRELRRMPRIRGANGRAGPLLLTALELVGGG